MSDCLVPSYHSPASSMQTLAPASESTCAATPPPAPEPTTITSYVLGVAFACAIPTILRLWRSSAPAQFQHPGGLRQQLLGQIGNSTDTEPAPALKRSGAATPSRVTD